MTVPTDFVFNFGNGELVPEDKAKIMIETLNLLHTQMMEQSPGETERQVGITAFGLRELAETLQLRLDIYQMKL